MAPVQLGGPSLKKIGRKKKHGSPELLSLSLVFSLGWGGGGKMHHTQKKTMVFTIYLTLLPIFFCLVEKSGTRIIESVTPNMSTCPLCPMVPCSQANCKCNPHLLHRSTHRCHLPKAPWEAKTLHQLDQTAKIADHL